MALLKKKEFETFYLKNISGGDPTPFEITQTQLLVGSSEKADIVLDDPTVNHYHAVITSLDGVMFITDLYSSNGTSVNGKNVRNAQLGAGDLIEFGNTKLEFGETVTENKMVDTNRKLKVVKPVLVSSKLPPLPDLPKPPAEREENPNLYYVDGEYCDIKFDETDHKNSKTMVLDNEILNSRAFIEEEDREYYPLLNDEEFTSQRSIEVVFVSRGNIMSYDVIPENDWKRANDHLSGEVSSYISFVGKKEKLIQFKDSKVTIRTPQGFVHVGKENDEVVLTSDDEIILEKGVHQIFIRFGKTVSKTQAVPWLWRDGGESKRVVQKFLVFFLPFLLLTLVSIEDIKEEKKNVVVIYKKKMKKEKKQSLASDSKMKDSAKKEEAKKISEKVSDISNKKKVKKKVEKKVAKTKNKTKNKKVAKSKTKASPKKKVAAKPRPQLKLAANFSKLLGSSQMKAKSFSASSSSSSGATSALSVASGSTLKTVGGGRSVKGLGTSSKFGNGKGYKSNGLGKSGFDSNFTSTKTVVLGSIDPDILRRLLREHIPQFRYCYQEELGRNKKLKGIIDLDFTINKNGKISSAKVLAKNGKFSGPGIGCITNVLKKIPFPKPKGGGYVEVRQPLNFSSEKTKV